MPDDVVQQDPNRILPLTKGGGLDIQPLHKACATTIASAIWAEPFRLKVNYWTSPMSTQIYTIDISLKNLFLQSQKFQKNMIHNILLKFLLHISSPKPKKKMAFLYFHLKVKGIAFLDTAITEVGGVLHSLLRCQEWQVRPSSAMEGGFFGDP